MSNPNKTIGEITIKSIMPLDGNGIWLTSIIIDLGGVLDQTVIYKRVIEDSQATTPSSPNVVSSFAFLM